VQWDLDSLNIKFREANVQRWEDPGRDNKRISLVDLSAKSGKPLENDGSTGVWKDDDNTSILTTLRSPTAKSQPWGHGTPNPPEKWVSKVTAMSCISTVTSKLVAIPPESPSSTTRGQGGVPPSARCDLQALSGRMERRETCVVNAAIMSSSWPHPRGAKKLNKPIVVDIDLPISPR